MASMGDIFQFDNVTLASFATFLAMSFVSIFLSLSFYLKLCAVRKLANNIQESVFDKTFNVFNPYPERRKTISSHVILAFASPLLVFVLAMVVTFTVVLKIIEMGFILGIPLSILCINVMMLSEASETYTNASSLLKAIRSKTGLAKGDLAVFDEIRRILPRMIAYYIFLAMMFLVLSISGAFLFPAFLLTFAQLIGTIFNLTSGVWTLPSVALFSATLITAIYIITNEVKRRVFGFPPSGPLIPDWGPRIRGIRMD